MAHDVFICYDEGDKNIAKKVCQSLEDNGVKCWFKARDVKVNKVGEATKAINQSQVFVLIYSAKAIVSNFVNNEVDIAFSAKKKFVIFNIDNSKLQGPLEFFLKNKPQIIADSTPEDKFDELVNVVKSQISVISKYKIPLIVAAIILIAIIGAYAFTAMNDGGNGAEGIEVSPGDVNLKITDFHVDDVRNQSTSWNYSYYVGGTISKDLGNSDKYKIVVDFYDKSGSLVNSTETVFADAQKINDGFLLGSTVSDKNDIKRVDVQLVDANDIIIAQDDSQL